MRVVTSERDGRYVLELKSALVGQSAEDLTQAVGQALEQEKFDLTLDMHGVSMIDSLGLEAILNTVKRCGSMGGTCQIEKASPKIKNIFRITRLMKDLSIV